MTARSLSIENDIVYEEHKCRPIPGRNSHRYDSGDDNE